MATLSLRVSDDEKVLIENYATMQGVTLSDVLKRAFFEKLEDEIDLQAIREHREAEARGEVKYYTLDEVEKDLGLN
jgi:uncharacterized protein (DUF1778 family)